MSYTEQTRKEIIETYVYLLENHHSIPSDTLEFIKGSILKALEAMETILKIEETTFDGKDGFVITTSDQLIKLGIDNEQVCCETWGYFMSEDNTNDFIGAKIISIKITDTLLKTSSKFDLEGMYEGGVMFVNVETNKGLLQFVAYNEHDGCYGHKACVVSKQLNKIELL